MLETAASATYTNSDRLRVFHVGGPERHSRAADVVFIHGISGHPLKTWIAKTTRKPAHTACEGWFLWLEGDLPGHRILSVGYPAAITAPFGFASELVDRSKMILQALVDKGIGERPTVFVAHSMGGILVKQMLRAALDRSNEANAQFFKNTRGIVFFATPHLGSSYAYVARLFLPFWFLSQSLRELASNDSRLRDLNEWMADRLMKHCVFAQYFENRSVLKSLPLIVPPGSAALALGERCLINIPVDANHIDICKLKFKGDQPYESVKNFIAQSVESARQPAPAQFIPVAPPNNASQTNGKPLVELRRAYLETGSIREGIDNYLAGGDSQLDFRCALIVAPSGYGKSTLAGEIFSRHGSHGRWINPSLSPCENEGKNLSLLVMDSVPAWKDTDRLFRDQVITLIHTCRNVIVCTTSQDTANELAAILGGYPRSSIFNLPSFTPDTAASFLRKYCTDPLLLAEFGKSDIKTLCELSNGIPGILVLAFDLMMNSPERFKAILRESRLGNPSAFACEVIKVWLPKLIGDETGVGQNALALLASEVNIFGLDARLIAALIHVEEQTVRQALAPSISLGYLQIAKTGYDDTLLPHPIIRSALQAGALPAPSDDDIVYWRRELARLSSMDESACLSSLTARVWATRETFVNLLSAKVNLSKSDLKAFYSSSQGLSKYLEQQFIDASKVQKALENAVGHKAISDCTIAISLARTVGAVTPPKPALGEAIWALTHHPDGMARCDAVVSAASHWRGYPVGQRGRCTKLVREFVSKTFNDDSCDTAGFQIGSALSALVLLQEEELACETFGQIVWRDPVDKVVGQSILALSLAAANSPRAISIWREMFRYPVQDECDAVARLFLCRSVALRDVRESLDPSRTLCRQNRLPIITQSKFRLQACGFYARNNLFLTFLDAVAERGWITENK